MDNVMETAQLRISFGTREVLKGIDLTIAKGQVTAIVGPSGCGKTTFLRSLNRLTDLTPGCKVEGRISLDGEDCVAMDPVLLRRRVGMVFQRPNPFPMSVRENVLYGVKAHGNGHVGQAAAADRFERRHLDHQATADAEPLSQALETGALARRGALAVASVQEGWLVLLRSQGRGDRRVHPSTHAHDRDRFHTPRPCSGQR